MNLDPPDQADWVPSKRLAVETDVDMTPMVDVTFLLLIFFMVTAAFALQKSFRTPVPSSEQPSSQPTTFEELEADPRNIVVRLDEFDTYHVSISSWSEPVEAPSPQDLLIQLRRAKNDTNADTPTTRMLLVCHGNAHHERVIQAMDAANEVGLEDVKLVTVSAAAEGVATEW